ncbi:MAG: ABC transporter ATP-binding protein [Chloroflexota bacterium]
MSSSPPQPVASAATPAGGAAPFAELRGIVKRYDRVTALAGVDLALGAAEVHAVVGENGAGKTTLMQILAGVQHPDAGEILVRGQKVAVGDVEAAYRLGIAMVHQHFMLFPSLTVAENLTLGREPRHRGGLFDVAAAEAAVRDLGDRYGLRVDPRKRVDTLSVGDLQRVEILRALYRGAQLLILDEPTAVLTPQEAEGLFQVVRELRAAGTATVFISHKLDEVLAIADRITVLRDGHVTGSRVAAGTTPAELARLMVGRELADPPARPAQEPGTPVIELRGLRGPGVRGVDLTVRAGEIVGVAGVAGNGQSELAELIAGLLGPTAGSVTVAGHDVTRATVREHRDAGLAYIPDDRFRRGLAADASIADNLVMGLHWRGPYAKRGIMDRGAVRRAGAALIARFGVKAGSVDDAARSLSGGNAQRVVIARELAREQPAIVVAQPTRGIDIGATRFVHGELLARRAAGAAILLISADLNEILALSDRIVVLYQGAIAGELPAGADPERIGLLMAGIKGDGAAGRPEADAGAVADQGAQADRGAAADVGAAADQRAGTTPGTTTDG